MNRTTVAAAALILGMAIASPMLAWSAAAPAQGEATQSGASGQSAPIIPPADPGQTAHGPIGGGAMMGDMGGRHGAGPMGAMMGEHMGMRGHGWMHRMMMHRMMRHMTPQQRCEERLARRAGVVAYTVAKLNLTAQQRPLWDKLHAVLQTQLEKGQQLCASLKGVEPEQQTLLDRLDRRQQALSARLDALQQIKPALEQLYQALTPEQQNTVNHPFRPSRSPD